MSDFNPTRAAELAAISEVETMQQDLGGTCSRLYEKTAAVLAAAGIPDYDPAIYARVSMLVAERDALARDLTEARAELEEARNDVAGYRHQKAALIAERDAARAEVRLLRQWVRHRSFCVADWHPTDINRCTCGFDSVLKERDE